ncbi:hypothetical protein BGX28_003817 [Mortierella sp. GBA30]|nr:hypothetical protein BGX28_003817 [Mortierella sp. GBA30]
MNSYRQHISVMFTALAVDWRDPRGDCKVLMNDGNEDSLAYRIEDALARSGYMDPELSVAHAMAVPFWVTMGNGLTRPLIRLTRWFRRKNEEIRFKNDTNTSICVMCTQDVLTIFKKGGAGVNAGMNGLDVKVDVANELVRSKEITTILKLGPGEEQYVSVSANYVTVSTFAVRDDTMILLYYNVLLRKGYHHTVEQKDVDNGLTDCKAEEFNSSLRIKMMSQLA